MLYRTQGKREGSSSYTKGLDMLQGDQPSMMEASSPTKKVGTLLSTDRQTEINSYYGPTVGDGEEDMEDPWDEHTDLVDETSNTNHNNNEDEEEEVDGGGGEDSELEDKFHCRPRYQHTRMDVSCEQIAAFHFLRVVHK
jgi:hypothetical protein